MPTARCSPAGRWRRPVALADASRGGRNPPANSHWSSCGVLQPPVPHIRTICRARVGELAAQSPLDFPAPGSRPAQTTGRRRSSSGQLTIFRADCRLRRISRLVGWVHPGVQAAGDLAPGPGQGPRPGGFAEGPRAAAPLRGLSTATERTRSLRRPGAILVGTRAVEQGTIGSLRAAATRVCRWIHGLYAHRARDARNPGRPRRFADHQPAAGRRRSAAAVILQVDENRRRAERPSPANQA